MSCDSNHQKYQVTDIQLQDSIIYQNYLDKTIGIPTKLRTHYEYLIHLSSHDKDTVISFITNSRLSPDDFIGDSIKIYDGDLTY